MPAETIVIPGRFNGPLESGNGGYCSGILAGQIEGPAEVSLRRPVPLDTPLDLLREEDRSVLLLDGETLIAEAHSVPDFRLDVPAPVTPEEARRAKGRYRAPDDGIFCRCFVCGRAREDSFGVFAGEVEGRDLVASPWTPPAWTADGDGAVRPEFVWSALDCPTFFAAYAEEVLPLSMLARLGAELTAPVTAEEEHLVIAWPLESDGRKRHAGAAVLDGDGTVLARARALMIEPRGTGSAG